MGRNSGGRHPQEIGSSIKMATADMVGSHMCLTPFLTHQICIKCLPYVLRSGETHRAHTAVIFHLLCT